MPKTIVSDTGCFIVLSGIGELELLHKTYGQILTTLEVAAEFGQPLPDWIEIKSPADKSRMQLLELQIDKGEASAIALAMETPKSILILDDYKARNIAKKLGLEITGTIGVIVKAKLKGIIPSIKPYLAKIRKTDFRLADDVEQQAFKEAGEN